MTNPKIGVAESWAQIRKQNASSVGDDFMELEIAIARLERDRAVV